MQVQFIFEPAVSEVGFAFRIISPALRESSMRKSWISWSSESCIVTVFLRDNGDRIAKSIDDRDKKSKGVKF